MSLLVIDALIFQNTKAFGYQEYLFNLLDCFYEYKDHILYDKIIIACDITQKKHFEKYRDKFDIHGFEIKNKLMHLCLQTFLAKLLNLKKNDVVLFTYNYSALIKRCKHVLVVHDLLYLRRNYLPNVLMRIQRRIYLPISLRLANVIIADSCFTKDDIIEYYKIKEDKINTVYIYLNLTKYKESDKNKSLLPKKTYYISVCSTAVHKNTITVLKAYEKYVKEGGAKNIVFIGGLSDRKSQSYKYYDGLSTIIKEKIIFYKNISNAQLSVLYANAYAFLSATLFEGFGMPVVEAMFFNLPEIVSDLKVIKEICHEKVCYFNPANYNELAIKMFELENNITKIDNKEYVINNFSEKNTSMKYIEILNKQA